jgi:hypothetical protein
MIRDWWENVMLQRRAGSRDDFGYEPVLSEAQIVFIHIGASIPSYFLVALKQVRLFNPSAPIYLIAGKQALEKVVMPDDLNICFYFLEDLAVSRHHHLFQKRCRLEATFRDGFWRYTTERFFYAEAFIRQENLRNVFLVENDIMIYADLNQIVEPCSTSFPTMAATFDNDHRCVPGLVYVAHPSALERLNTYIANNASKGDNDMLCLAKFRRAFGEMYMGCLPIVPESYYINHGLKSRAGKRSRSPHAYFKHADTFCSLFDAAAVGQYLGGIDPRNQNPGEVTLQAGFVNESSLFNPDLVCFEWHPDDDQRLIPYMKINDEMWRMNNLHIHSKNLVAFCSQAESTMSGLG